MFKWATSHELIPGSVHHALVTVEGLRKGRSAAVETGPVKPVPDPHSDAVRPLVSRPVRGITELQLLTGARPGELLIMRPVDLDMRGRVWTYISAAHKTAHHGHERVVYIGPRGQQVIRPLLAGRAIDAYLFSPREAELERKQAEAEGQRRPNQPPTPRKTDRTIGDRYTPASYRRAIERACGAAGVPTWAPHRLRHNAASYLRREFGIDVAQTILGHRLGSNITEVSAEANVAKAIDVIGEKLACPHALDSGRGRCQIVTVYGHPHAASYATSNELVNDPGLSTVGRRADQG